MSKMVQVFMVLRCFSCETFQVHQVKKSSNKWLCKLCNEKQSVQKVYGKGTAADCRQHVQKLNMLRGEKDMAEQQMLNHPPEDYAETFDEKHHHGNDQEPEHPVLLTGKGSKWKLYTEPQDSNSEEEAEDAGLYTTDKAEFDQAHRKKHRDLKSRRGSDPSSKPHPLSKASQKHCLPDHTPSASHSQTPVHPYSAVSDEMGQLLSGAKSSCYLHSSSDRYHKLNVSTEVDTSSQQHNLPLSDSVDEYSSSQRQESKSGVFQSSPGEKQRHPHMSREDKMARIRDDIGRFSKKTTVARGNPPGEVIPAVSSRWSKFMSESEEGEGEEGGGSIKAHMLQSRIAVSKYD